MTFYLLGWTAKYFVPLRILCPLYTRIGVWNPISHNNSNKTTLYLHDALPLKCTFIYVIQIIEGTSYGGRVGGEVFKRGLIVLILQET